MTGQNRSRKGLRTINRQAIINALGGGISRRDHLAGLPAVERVRLAERCPGLAEYLDWVPDPRARRGVRRPLARSAAEAADSGDLRCDSAGEKGAFVAPGRVPNVTSELSEPFVAHFDTRDVVAGGVDRS